MATRVLSCKLVAAEREARARETTELLAEEQRLTDLEKGRAKAAKAEIEAVSTRLTEAARAAREGWEMREVEVDIRPNATDLTIETWRLDTGELVGSRPMDDEEKRRTRQPRLLRD